MILCFPDLDTFRLVVTSSILPVSVTLSEADMVIADDGRVFVEAQLKPTKKAAAELTKLNVSTAKVLPAEPARVSCWLQIIPVTKDPTPPQLSSSAPVLFELPSAQDLPGIVTEMLRLGNDRQSFRWIASPDDSTDRRVLLRVIGPPYYTLLRALDQLAAGKSGPIRAYLEQAPRVWVEIGHTHPFAAQVKLADDQTLLIRSPREWFYLPETPFQDVYDILQFKLAHAAVEWKAIDDESKLTVPLKLVPGNAADAAELWVLRDSPDDQLDRFVKEADERLTQRLRFAVADTQTGQRVIVLKLAHSRTTPPALSLPGAVAYHSHPSLPNLFIPIGTRLHPQLRRDAVRSLLADDLDSIVWLTPTGNGTFTPESIADEAFHPLEDWVDYVIETAHIPLKEWIESTRFDFGGFVCGDEKQPKPKDPGRGPKDRPKSDKDSEPLTGPGDAKKGGASKGAADRLVPVEVLPQQEQKKPNEWKIRRDDLQKQFLGVDGPLDHPDRVELWPQLAVANAGAGDIAEAALCWANALWAKGGPDAVLPIGWARSEFPQSNGSITAEEFSKRLKQSDPPRGDVRQFAAAVFALASQPNPPAWLISHLTDVQKFIETNEPKLSVRAAWLVATRLACLSGADVLGVARMRDRLLQRLLEQGLNAELDLPFFLRTAGLNDSERVRMIRDEATDLHKLVRKWAEVGSKSGTTPTNVEGNPTVAYVDLLFAYGLAKLGEIQAATKLMETAKTTMERFPADSKVGIGSRFLFRAFKYRIDQAINGQPLSGRLPPAMYDELEEIDKKSKNLVNSPHGNAHYAITRLQQQSKVIEPYDRPDPYKKFTVDHEGGLKKRLYDLYRERDPQRLTNRIREEYRAEARKPDPKDKGKGTVVSDNQFDILLECLPLSARCGGSFAAEMIRFVPDALRQSFPQVAGLSKKQGELLERGLFLAGHFDHRDLVSLLVDSFIEVVNSKSDDQRMELINVVAGECLRSLRKLGLRDEIDKLLTQLLAAMLGKAAFKDLKSKYSGKTDLWLKALRAMLNIASGWLTFGMTDRATPILDEARAEILAPLCGKVVHPIEFTNLVRTYISAVGHGPTEDGLRRITEVFQKIESGKISNGYTSAEFYSRFHLNVTEDVVMAVVSDDFALGTAGRRWLEDDEQLVRRRIHHDMRTLLAESKL